MNLKDAAEKKAVETFVNHELKKLEKEPVETFKNLMGYAKKLKVFEEETRESFTEMTRSDDSSNDDSSNDDEYNESIGSMDEEMAAAVEKEFFS